MKITIEAYLRAKIDEEVLQRRSLISSVTLVAWMDEYRTAVNLKPWVKGKTPTSKAEFIDIIGTWRVSVHGLGLSVTVFNTNEIGAIHRVVEHYPTFDPSTTHYSTELLM